MAETSKASNEGDNDVGMFSVAGQCDAQPPPEQSHDSVQVPVKGVSV